MCIYTACQGSACTPQQELGCQRCSNKQRLPAKDRQTAKVCCFRYCATILLSRFALTPGLCVYILSISESWCNM